MTIPLTQKIEDILDSNDIKVSYKLLINSIDYTDYLISANLSSSTEFNSAQATFVLDNGDASFGKDGLNEVNIGDIVEYYKYFTGDSTEFKEFYGFINNRNVSKSATDRTISLICLDYISILQNWDIDLTLEADKIAVQEETLTPNYLDSPNENLAQVFDFANDSLSDNPPPIINIRNQDDNTDDPAYDGMEIYYSDGQLKLGYCINARYNYSVIAKKYYFYTDGMYVEDMIQSILTEPNEYGGYLFDESSAANIIANHLTSTYYDEKSTNTDTMIPNYTTSTITLKTTLAVACSAGDTSITVNNIDIFPSSGEASINGDIFTWSSKSGNNLQGIPSSGSYALSDHAVDSVVKYEEDYSAGQVWYLDYSNLSTDLTSGDFTIPGGTFRCLDKRNGRIILESAISTTTTVTCNSNYTFCTLQTAGVQLNYISFNPRETENRLEAIKNILEYCPPNYIIRTKGDNKIWASLLSQKSTADYTLTLSTQATYLEDSDLYTRVKIFGKNKNPTNIMFDDGVGFTGTGETYTGIATAIDLAWLREESGYYVYGCALSSIGQIDATNIKPMLYINDVPVNNTSNIVASQQVSVEVTTTTETTSQGKCLPKGTLIALENNKTIKIEEIKTGDVVKGGKVVKVHKSIHKLPLYIWQFEFSKNRFVKASYVHPFAEEVLNIKRTKKRIKTTYDILTDSGYYYVNNVKCLSTLDNNYNEHIIYYNKNKLFQCIGRWFLKILNKISNKKNV